MDYNVLFKISKDSISISQIKKEVDYKSLNNTNIIDVKELKFSSKYIEENYDLVASFLNTVIIKFNITKVIINNLDIALMSLDLINLWDNIKKVIFKPQKRINLDIVLKIMESNTIEEIECFEISSYLLERLDVNKNIRVITKNEYNKKTRFMIINNINCYTDIYYKKSIVLSGTYSIEELIEFKEFLSINEKLKVIKVISFTNELITSIVEEIVKDKKKNITIEINEKDNDINMIFNTVTYLKKSYHLYFEENNIKFKMNYSKEYKHNNFFKEINVKMFSTIIIFVVLLSTIVVLINYYQQYLDENKINDEMGELTEILNNSEQLLSIDDNESDIEYIDSSSEITTKKKSQGGNYVSAYYTNYKQVFDQLLSINKDTVGWLTVNNTKINYPVVKASTNSYYLNHDFNKKKNSMGWIFVDYRNDMENLDSNTIIYGHNIKTGIMFGTIKTMMNSSWYKNPNNLIITFNTPTKNMKWKIFSLYKTKVTDDYLAHEFATPEEKMEFLNMIKSRSIKNFGVELNENSKILTLSTCFSHTTRHVVHAVLIEETSNVLPEENTEQAQ